MTKLYFPIKIEAIR